MTKKRTILIFSVCLLLFSSVALPEDDQTAGLTDEPSAENITSPSPSLPLKPEIESGLYLVIKQGGGLMIPILLLALLGLALIIERSIYFVKNKIYRKESMSLYLEQIDKSSDAQFREELEDELSEEAQIFINKAERGLALLNGVGNLAPLVGFFGTVVGMISAFAAIAQAATVNAKVVAVGIQVALVTTAGGLAVAVPVLAFYHIFNHLIQNLYEESEAKVVQLSANKKRLSS